MLIVALFVKVWKIQQAKEAKIDIFDDRNLSWRPSSAISLKYPHDPYLARNKNP